MSKRGTKSLDRHRRERKFERFIKFLLHETGRREGDIPFLLPISSSMADTMETHLKCRDIIKSDRDKYWAKDKSPYHFFRGIGATGTTFLIILVE